MSNYSGMKLDLKSKISVLLLMLSGIGLAISTLHSHHHLQWNHAPDFPDTGHCISVDTTVCPISGYIFETDVLSASNTVKAFFESVELTISNDIVRYDSAIAANRGRSPPV